MVAADDFEAGRTFDERASGASVLRRVRGWEARGWVGGAAPGAGLRMRSIARGLVETTSGVVCVLCVCVCVCVCVCMCVCVCVCVCVLCCAVCCVVLRPPAALLSCAQRDASGHGGGGAGLLGGDAGEAAAGEGGYAGMLTPQEPSQQVTGCGATCSRQGTPCKHARSR